MWKPILAAGILATASNVNALKFSFGSSSSCSSTAVAQATSDSEDAFVNLGVEIGGLICNTEDITSRSVEVWLEKVAYAVADTSVYVSAGCTFTGSGTSGSASADAAARATAETHAEALLQGFVSLDTCGKCKAQVAIFGESSKSAFVESVSEAWVAVDGSDGSEDAQSLYRRNIEQALIPTLAGLVVEVHAGFSGVGEVCGISASGGVATGENGVSCETFVESFTVTESVNAVATAAADASAYSCEELPSQAAAAAVAHATAYAFAAAVTESDSQCRSAGNGLGCIHSASSISTVVKATADAYAAAWAEAGNAECGCDANTESVSQQFAEIILSVASDAYSEACVEGEETFAQADAFALAVEEASVTAIAAALAEAVAGWDNCGVATETIACVGCVGLDEQCAYRDLRARRDVVLGCCDPTHTCIKQNSSRSWCKAEDFQIPFWWSGDIRTCDENPDK